MNVKTSPLDIICAGECLVDLCSHEKGMQLSDSSLFKKLLGGSAANIAVNLARLGSKSSLLAAIGNDGFGKFLKNELSRAGVEGECLQVIPDQPTSLIVASQIPGAPEYMVYRGADYHISANSFPRQVLTQCRIFHTSCFALSINPARASLIELVQLAVQQGVQLSLDLNYTPQIWRERQEAIDTIGDLLALQPLVKLSEEDALRLYRQPMQPEKVIEQLLQQGAELVCLTLGKRGSMVASRKQEAVFVPSKDIPVVIDAKGAGDAYWAGFLHTYLMGKNLADCAAYGAQVAAAKLQKVGPLDMESVALI